MRSEPGVDYVIPSFILTCPGYRSGQAESGNLSFMIGNDVQAEIQHEDLLESWTAAEGLSAAEVLKMSQRAGEHLAEIMEGGLEASDLTEAVTDAAVVFLLALKRYGVSDPKRIPPCTVIWNGQEGRSRVLLGA